MRDAIIFRLLQGNFFAFHPLYLLRQEQPAARHVFECALNRWIGSLPRTLSGLGLNISRKLARMMGGDVTVDERAGQRFGIHRPAAK
jgi:hypothetical protein